MPPGARTPGTAAALRAAGGVLGGWLSIMPPSVVTLALRLREMDPSGLPSTYSVILASGWLACICGLIAFGHLSDLVLRRRGSRRLVIAGALPALGVTSVLLALSPTPLLLGAAWVAAQLPASALVAASSARVADDVPSGRRGIASGLVGGAPILALALGTVIVRAVGDDVAIGFVLPAVIGAVLALPLALSGDNARQSRSGRTPVRDSRYASGAVLLVGIGAWIAFLSADFLLSIATSVTNGYLVPYAGSVVGIPADEVAAFTTGVVIVSACAALLASVAAGSVSHSGRAATLIFGLAGLLMGIDLLILSARPSATALLICGVAFGAFFGAANGAELAAALALRGAAPTIGRDLGILTAVTSAPYVLVPGVATVLLAGDPVTGLRGLFAAASPIALAAGVVMMVLARRMSSARMSSGRAGHRGIPVGRGSRESGR